MTSESGMSDIVERARIKSGMLKMGERIAFGSDSELLDEMAAEIERLRSLLKEAGEALEPIAQRWIDPLSIAREHWRAASTVLSKIKGEA